MEFNELLLKRRSTRSYTGGAIPGSEIRSLLEAGLRAPNACNHESWHFYCICDKAKIECLWPEIYRGEWIKGASVVILISLDTKWLADKFGDVGITFAYEDAGAAAENILLRAADLGYNGCFIGAFDHAKCRAYLSIPENEEPAVMLSIGTVDGEVPLRERKPFEETVTFIGSLPEEEAKPKDEKPFEVRNAWIPGALLDDVGMPGTKFNNVNMEGARFTDINMKRSFFGGLTLEESYFGCVDLRNATFENPDFTGAVIKNCRLNDVEIVGCEIDGLTIDGKNVKELLKK